MAALKMAWATPAKKQFDEVVQRAVATGGLDEFVVAHAEPVDLLSTVEMAIEKSDPLYNTKKPGGVVRHLYHRFLSATFYLVPDERVGWITKYRTIPASWPA